MIFRPAVLAAVAVIALGASDIPRIHEQLHAATQHNGRIIKLTLSVFELKDININIREGDEGVIDLKERGKFAFAPTVRNDDSAKVVVAIWDLANSERRKMGEVIAPAGGDEVLSTTEPPFRIRIRSVASQ
jgi:hypothetical protein